MESWRRVWRDGVLPSLSVDHLTALREALESDSPHLLQGATCTPPPLACVQDCPVKAACLLSYPGVTDHGGFGQAMVHNAEESFARLCYDADQRIGEPAVCRWLINWFDDTPRDEMRRLLLPEVRRGLDLLAAECARELLTVSGSWPEGKPAGVNLVTPAG